MERLYSYFVEFGLNTAEQQFKMKTLEQRVKTLENILLESFQKKDFGTIEMNTRSNEWIYRKYELISKRKQMQKNKNYYLTSALISGLSACGLALLQTRSDMSDNHRFYCRTGTISLLGIYFYNIYQSGQFDSKFNTIDNHMKFLKDSPDSFEVKKYKTDLVLDD